jgi:hypothetical protein
LTPIKSLLLRYIRLLMVVVTATRKQTVCFQQSNFYVTVGFELFRESINMSPTGRFLVDRRLRQWEQACLNFRLGLSSVRVSDCNLFLTVEIHLFSLVRALGQQRGGN